MVTGTDDGLRAAGVAPVLGQRVLRPRQQVEDALRKAVLGGLLRTGERLPAEAIIDGFDVQKSGAEMSAIPPTAVDSVGHLNVWFGVAATVG